ncbi:hypothetical protein KC19_1G195100 [Ceratodon purpureus]|uniref:Secreted protein n=1 Tax=Ceratodon purpureus TaxID=3225 RepID=A0A8T0JA36_CERPU|nr:hypothetical protein KC19_1G195100 [Ceratodon purpureus]
MTAPWFLFASLPLSLSFSACLPCLLCSMPLLGRICISVLQFDPNLVYATHIAASILHKDLGGCVPPAALRFLSADQGWRLEFCYHSSAFGLPSACSVGQLIQG